MRTLYLAGPMTGRPFVNLPAFRAAAARLREQGHPVVSPAEPEAEQNSRPWEEWMRRDIVLLLGCDAVAVLPGWESSRGATLEIHIARSLGMSILCAETLQELPAPPRYTAPGEAVHAWLTSVPDFWHALDAEERASWAKDEAALRQLLGVHRTSDLAQRATAVALEVGVDVPDPNDPESACSALLEFVREQIQAADEARYRVEQLEALLAVTSDPPPAPLLEWTSGEIEAAEVGA